MKTCSKNPTIKHKYFLDSKELVGLVIMLVCEKCLRISVGFERIHKIQNIQQLPFDYKYVRMCFHRRLIHANSQ